MNVPLMAPCASISAETWEATTNVSVLMEVTRLALRALKMNKVSLLLH